VDAFEEFTEVAARSFGDRVKQWTTMNEPFCSAFLGYELGVHAPGMKDLSLAVKASHHLLLVHGAAVSVLHSRLPGSKVGNVLNTSPFYPYTQSVQDRDAARHGDGRLTRWFLDPPYNRQYPLDILDDYVKEGGLSSTTPEFIQDGDMEKIAVPTDFLGINYYNRTINDTDNARAQDPAYRENERTDMGWKIFPFGLYEFLVRIYFTYKPAEIMITENGARNSDGPDGEGRVRDAGRIAYLRSHIAAVHRAIEAGVPVTGYYVWSLLDNFEWGQGFSQRFGLIHVDYQTLKRTPKDSALWYVACGIPARQPGVFWVP